MNISDRGGATAAAKLIEQLAQANRNFESHPKPATIEHGEPHEESASVRTHGKGTILDIRC